MLFILLSPALRWIPSYCQLEFYDKNDFRVFRGSLSSNVFASKGKMKNNAIEFLEVPFIIFYRKEVLPPQQPLSARGRQLLPYRRGPLSLWSQAPWHRRL